ncbi:MAG: hypothetical protein NTX79_02915 [Candidatus Micrarchaeota archaeon]|nr:hypothetical protein [Candidatus Micrarchaeota archaeon]
MDESYLKKLVVARLKTIPPNVGFSVGSHGDFSRDQIIKNVMDNTAIGKEFSQLELRMLIDTPKLVGRLSGTKASSY